MRTARQLATVDDTRQFATELAAALLPGDVVVLSGPLGAGKTTFVQGLAAALGVNEPVTSPTFVIARVYETESGSPLIHVDAYRMSSGAELDDLGIDDDADASLTVVEWGRGSVEHWSRSIIDIEIRREDDDVRFLDADFGAARQPDRFAHLVVNSRRGDTAVSDEVC